MSAVSQFDPSIILDGPVFRDELRTQPQQFRRHHDVDHLRLVPGKSAASGVCTIYFIPEHREWALVRLTIRYRWVLELQLNRGLSGEQQMLRQGFAPEDVEFLMEIIPLPPTEYNPIVYDMLWLVAIYDEYLELTRAIHAQERFIPRELLTSITSLDTSDVGFLSRFLRSHLIRQADDAPDKKHGPSQHATGDRAAKLDKEYVVTREGHEALEGIVQEYDRIFEQQDFEPLLINPDADPHEHLKVAAEAKPSDVGINVDMELQSGDELAEIVSAFSSIDPDEESKP